MYVSLIDVSAHSLVTMQLWRRHYRDNNVEVNQLQFTTNITSIFSPFSSVNTDLPLKHVERVIIIVTVW